MSEEPRAVIIPEWPGLPDFPGTGTPEMVLVNAAMMELLQPHMEKADESWNFLVAMGAKRPPGMQLRVVADGILPPLKKRIAAVEPQP